MKSSRFVVSLALAATSSLMACSSASAPTPIAVMPTSAHIAVHHPSTTYNKIQHVVVIIQENRSLNNLFMGFKGASTVTSGRKSGGASIGLSPMNLGPSSDIDHSWSNAMTAWDNGSMDSFNLETLMSTGQNAGNYPYSYVPHDAKNAGPYWDIAEHYVLADNMYPTEFGPSFTAHLNLLASTDIIDENGAPNAHALADFPNPTQVDWGCDNGQGTATNTVRGVKNGPWTYSASGGPFPCFNGSQFHTIIDTLDAHDVSWRYYAPGLGANGAQWSILDAIQRIRCASFNAATQNCKGYGADWANVHSPSASIFNDLAKGDLAQVTWVVPSGLWSDHAGPQLTNAGPSWVADIINAIGANKTLWDSTAIIVVWDDWGGWYDHVAPPQMDFRGLGIRVPCLIVSPYARGGGYYYGNYVDHTQYESGSVVHFIEDVFGLPTLQATYGGLSNFGAKYSDERASDMFNAFNFSYAQPRPFVKITPVQYPPSYFQQQYNYYNYASLVPDTE